jgi:chemotaxis protein CheD
VTDATHKLTPVNYLLEPGYIYVAAEPTVISTVLGSCVSVSIYDRRRKVGGMNHFLYPTAENDNEATAIFGDAATLNLIRMMVRDGSKRKDLEAQIIGGAYNSDISPTDMGRKNVMTARRILARQRVKVVSEDVGGTLGRKVVFHTNVNEIALLKVEKIRQSDWYPYEGRRE